MEELAATPVKECLELLSGSINSTAEKEVLTTSFATFVEFAFAISRRVEKFVEVELKSTPFFLWVWKGLMRGAKELRRRGVRPEMATLIILGDISEDFQKIRSVFTVKAAKNPMAKETAGTSSVKKEGEKESEKREAEKGPEKQSKKKKAEEKGAQGSLEKEAAKEAERNSLNDSKQASEKEFEKALEKAFEQFLRAQNK